MALAWRRNKSHRSVPLDKWIWDDQKDRANRIKHGIRFETAALAFSDPMHLTLSDPYPWEQRWQTYGLIQQTLIVVVHTEPGVESATGDRVGRIISARKATKSERRAFEEAKL